MLLGLLVRRDSWRTRSVLIVIYSFCPLSVGEGDRSRVRSGTLVRSQYLKARKMDRCLESSKKGREEVILD